MNKYLFIAILIILPITIISFFKKETIFNSKTKKEEEYIVKVQKGSKILYIPLEEYIIGVVAAEMPALFETEALKAQALASRTYAINYLDNNNVISSTTNNQAYITIAEMQEKWQDKYLEYYEKISNIVKETKGQIIKYENKPIKAFYYSSSNGFTADSRTVFNESYDYLQTRESSWDAENYYSINLTKEVFCDKLQINCSENIQITDAIKDSSNRVISININNKNFKGTDIRKLLNLRSTDFKINIEENVINITTNGYGHGVGMSQYGANSLAKLGYNYTDILKYYYPNTEIDNI